MVLCANCGTCWKERTKLEFFLISVLVLTLALTFCATIWPCVVFVRGNEKSVNVSSRMLKLQGVDSGIAVAQENVCETNDCIATASRIKRYMNSSVDPCENFYQFACGNFVKTTNIPDDQYSINEAVTFGTKISEKLRTLIEKPIEPNEPKPFQLIKKMYKACMDENLIEKDSLKTMKSILKEMGGWPVLEGSSWNQSAFSWMNLTYKLKELGYGIRSFVSFSVGVDLKNSSRNTLYIDQKMEDPFLYLPGRFFTKRSETLSKYLNYMVEVAVLFGANRKSAFDELKESINFEKQLQRISSLEGDFANIRIRHYNPISVEELQRKSPNIQWLELINTLLAPAANINSKEVVIVSSLEYIQNFLALINGTSKRVQANYAVWKAVEQSLPFLNEALRKYKEDFTRDQSSGLKTKEMRWQKCTDISTAKLNIAAGALYIKNYFDEESRHKVLDMFLHIRAEFGENLKKNKWLDEETKKNAFAKAENMFGSIGYPEEILDNPKLEEYYRNLELDGNNFLKLVLNVSIFQTRLDFKNLKKLVNRTEWIIDASKVTVVNAMYDSTRNALTVTAAILQGLLFNAKLPQYMNFGAIGFVISHEITHGFDSTGHRFDEFGNFRNWWTPKTEQAFSEKSSCFLLQYNRYFIPDANQNVNGFLTYAENIADNGGVKLAYSAYNNWVKKHGVENRLPELNYSQNQLFWISLANTKCTKYRPRVINYILAMDVHAPEPARTNIALGNSEYFAKDFNCPLGSNMNPKKKCSVW